MRALLALLLILLAGPRAHAETLISSLSTHQVLITSTYTGASIVIFGSIERDAYTVARAAPYDLVITVRGPRRTALVRQKERLGAMWLNRSQRRFVDLPVFLAVLSTRPLDQVADLTTRLRFKIGIEAVLAPPSPALDTAGPEFRAALVRLKTQQGLFFENPRGVTFLSSTLFRAPILLPATAPTGIYDVDVQLLAGGVALSRQTTNFEVIKTGFEEQTAEVARDHPIAYGIGTAALALAFGWLATMIFRRD